MFNSREREIAEYIDMHCEDFPFPSAYEVLFTEEELELIAIVAESTRNFLKEVNKVKLPKEERIDKEKFSSYYIILMEQIFGKSLVHKLDKKIESMRKASYEKDSMDIYRDYLNRQLATKEGKVLKDKLKGILERKTKKR